MTHTFKLILDKPTRGLSAQSPALVCAAAKYTPAVGPKGGAAGVAWRHKERPGGCCAAPGWIAQTRRRAKRRAALPVWWAATVMMGDIGEEITEIELEPPPEEMPAEPPVEPAMEPVPG